jgi:hypothetical protein
MYFFTTRYEAEKAYPNAIIRKTRNTGLYVCFNDCSTFESWVAKKLVSGYKQNRSKKNDNG